MGISINTVKNIIGAAFGSAGERCMAAAVVIAVGDIGDKLVKHLKEAADELKMGNGLDEGIFLGPVICKSHKERTIGYIKRGIEEGAKLVRDGRGDKAQSEGGYFVGPTIFDEVTQEMKIWKDEIFAPVLSIVRVDTPMLRNLRTAPTCIRTARKQSANSAKRSTQAYWV
jgi:malonate-semialdehyde dehydrogenase (acetylating)/methylmalonate-semialdehyde dehydrogenase